MKRRISAVVPARSLEERGSKALKTTLNGQDIIIRYAGPVF